MFATLRDRLKTGVTAALFTMIDAMHLDRRAVQCEQQPQPAAFVIDDEVRISQFVTDVLATLGIRSQSFRTAKEAIAALERDMPSVIFLDVALLQSDAIDVVHGLGRAGYRGIVHLMSGGNPSLVEAVQRIGARQGVSFGAPLAKPVTREAITTALHRHGWKTKSRS